MNQYPVTDEINMYFCRYFTAIRLTSQPVLILAINQNGIVIKTKGESVHWKKKLLLSKVGITSRDLGHVSPQGTRWRGKRLVWSYKVCHVLSACRIKRILSFLVTTLMFNITHSRSPTYFHSPTCKHPCKTTCKTRLWKPSQRKLREDFKSILPLRWYSYYDKNINIAI